MFPRRYLPAPAPACWKTWPSCWTFESAACNESHDYFRAVLDPGYLQSTKHNPLYQTAPVGKSHPSAKKAAAAVPCSPPEMSAR